MKHKRAMIGIVCLLMAVTVGITACSKSPVETGDREEQTTTQATTQTTTQTGDDLSFLDWIGMLGTGTSPDEETTKTENNLPPLNDGDVVEAVYAFGSETFTDDNIGKLERTIKDGLINRGLLDCEVYADPEKCEVIALFSWDKEDEDSISDILVDLGMDTRLEFRMGSQTVIQTDEDGNMVVVPTGELVISGKNVVSAEVQTDPTTLWPVVKVELDEKGTAAFAAATAKQAAEKGTISVWLNGGMIFNPQVGEAITDGKLIITGIESVEEAETLAHHINVGTIPYRIQAISWRWVD